MKREVGDRQGEMTALANLATVYAALGEAHQAVETLRETSAAAPEVARPAR